MCSASPITAVENLHRIITERPIRHVVAIRITSSCAVSLFVIVCIPVVQY